MGGGWDSELPVACLRRDCQVKLSRIKLKERYYISQIDIMPSSDEKAALEHCEGLLPFCTNILAKYPAHKQRARARHNLISSSRQLPC
jgi:hypothetical protein